MEEPQPVNRPNTGGEEGHHHHVWDSHPTRAIRWHIIEEGKRFATSRLGLDQALEHRHLLWPSPEELREPPAATIPQRRCRSGRGGPHRRHLSAEAMPGDVPNDSGRTRRMRGYPARVPWCSPARPHGHQERVRGGKGSREAAARKVGGSWDVGALRAQVWAIY
jgi:hypothetical protein